ncbi:MAG: TIM barrel protein [Candidatus Dependentiae bacterium]|nr:TIM barrel protein [Candidatus Dependentiae bacterium]
MKDKSLVSSIKNKNNRLVGLHVRLRNGIFDVVQAVEQMQVPIVQSFLLDESGSYVPLFNKTVREFTAKKEELGFLHYVHAAYWSSLVDVGSKEFRSLCKEAHGASRLNSDGIVVHVGATRERLDKKDQVLYVANAVNELLYQVPNITLILENIPHAGRNFGGDLMDFGLLLEHIEQKNRVKFCIDTAHAFVFGYNLTDESGREDFFKLMQDIFTKDQIALLHINDTTEFCGSHIDKHEIPGDGILGQNNLSWFMNHEFCKNIPILMELPASCSDERSLDVLKRVTSWEV